MNRRLSILTLTLVASQATALFAQDITGAWQGTIHTAKDFREVIQISKDGNVLKAALIGLDAQPGLIFKTQPGLSFTSTAVNLQRNAIRMEFPGLGAVYQGTLSADGNSIAGGLTQNGATLTLNLVRATAQTAWQIPEIPAPQKPAIADTNPTSFEVATIKPTPPGTRGGGSGPDPGGRFTARNTTLGGLIAGAYGLTRSRMENVPGWLDTDRYDITAKADFAGTLSNAQVAVMMKKLLADRLKLRSHREKKEATFYELTVQSSGSKLTPSKGDPNDPTSPGGMTRQPGHWHVSALNVKMETLAGGLGGVLDQPVTNHTGLSGRFDISLDWAPDELQSAGNPPPDNPTAFPDLFTALKDQLGLKLERTKARVDILVIDHVEKPSEN